MVFGCRRETLDLRWTGPDGRDHTTSAVMLVSNDPYRLGRVLGSGTRPRLDGGVLGITAVQAGAAVDGGIRRQEWAAPSFEVHSDQPIATGIDGEAARLDPPLRFRSRPQALRVRIAPQHPGASPSAAMPADLWAGFRSVARVAIRGSL